MAKGYALPLVLVAMIILVMLCFGETMTSYTTRIQAVSERAETEAMLAAEAGYEKAIFLMCQQSDILGWLQQQGCSAAGNINFVTSTCTYQVDFKGFLGSKALFRVKSIGKSGRPVYTRVVDVNVMQEPAGWAMGACRVPTSGTSSSETSTYPVSFTTGETINTPIHINNYNDSPDLIDISISGTPQFLQKVEMGESRKTSGGTDKYSGIMTCFNAGIDFDQPNVRITDGNAVASKVARFRDSTLPAFKFSPPGRAAVGNSNPSDPCGAVQLQFYVDNSVGKIRIFPSCTVRHYRRSSNYTTWDYNSAPDGSKFNKYDIYAYHYFDPNDGNNKTVNVTDTYVSQTFCTYTSDQGGQIFVNGNVIIGGDSNSVIDPNQKGQIVKGKITVVATGNIWIGDPIYVDDDGNTLRDVNGMPTLNNPNVLGLIAQGVIKVVDPGLSNYTGSGFTITATNPAASPCHLYPQTNCTSEVNDAVYNTPTGCHKHCYQPIGMKKYTTTDVNNVRCLPHNVIVEAAITVGGGGWGAENVSTGSSGPERHEYTDGTQDNLIVHGSITEVVRGVVGYPSQNDGFIKQYTIDQRLMTGILPGDIWFTGTFIPAPAGWHDESISEY